MRGPSPAGRGAGHGAAASRRAGAQQRKLLRAQRWSPAFTNSRNSLSNTKTDPSSSVHDPFPSLVLLGLVYPRFCCRMRLFVCRCPHLQVPSVLGRGQLQQRLPERRMRCRDTRLEALVAAGGFISVRPKSGLGRSGGHWVGAGSGDTSPAVPCPHSCSQRVLPAHFLTLHLHFLPAGSILQLPLPTWSLKPHGDTSGSSSLQERCRWRRGGKISSCPTSQAVPPQPHPR